MAEISYTYITDCYSINSYNDVLETYLWLERACESNFDKKSSLKVSSRLTFKFDQIQYECKSIDEFKKLAFGKNILFLRMTLYIYDNINHNSLMFVFVEKGIGNENIECIINSDDELIISNYVENLKITQKNTNQNKETLPINVINSAVSIGGDAININSEKNNLNESASNESGIKKADKEKLSSKIMWQIIIPIIIRFRKIKCVNGINP